MPIEPKLPGHIIKCLGLAWEVCCPGAEACSWEKGKGAILGQAPDGEGKMMIPRKQLSWDEVWFPMGSSERHWWH